MVLKIGRVFPRIPQVGLDFINPLQDYTTFVTECDKKVRGNILFVNGEMAHVKINRKMESKIASFFFKEIGRRSIDWKIAKVCGASCKTFTWDGNANVTPFFSQKQTKKKMNVLETFYKNAVDDEQKGRLFAQEGEDSEFDDSLALTPEKKNTSEKLHVINNCEKETLKDNLLNKEKKTENGEINLLNKSSKNEIKTASTTTEQKPPRKRPTQKKSTATSDAPAEAVPQKPSRKRQLPKKNVTAFEEAKVDEKLDVSPKKNSEMKKEEIMEIVKIEENLSNKKQKIEVLNVGDLFVNGENYLFDTEVRKKVWDLFVKNLRVCEENSTDNIKKCEIFNSLAIEGNFDLSVQKNVIKEDELKIISRFFFFMFGKKQIKKFGII